MLYPSTFQHPKGVKAFRENSHLIPNWDNMCFGLIKSKPAGRRRACRRPSFVRPKEAKARPGLKKNLFAYAADARWDELKPDAHPPRQGNSPSFIGLFLAPADFSKGRPAKQE